MSFGSKSDSRDYALYGVFERLQEYILNDNNLCDKAFRIYESKDIDLQNGMPIYRFGIREIPTEIQHLIIPTRQEISPLPGKYNFKERIRILFKGE